MKSGLFIVKGSLVESFKVKFVIQLKSTNNYYHNIYSNIFLRFHNDYKHLEL